MVDLATAAPHEITAELARRYAADDRLSTVEAFLSYFVPGVTSVVHDEFTSTETEVGFIIRHGLQALEPHILAAIGNRLKVLAPHILGAIDGIPGKPPSEGL